MEGEIVGCKGQWWDGRGNGGMEEGMVGWKGKGCDGRGNGGMEVEW